MKQSHLYRVLCIAPKTDGRWPVELAQRFDFEVRTVYGHDETHLGALPERGLFVQGRSDVEARLLQELNEPTDVVVSGVAPGALGENVTNRLRAMMRNGVGYVGPTEGFDLSDWKADEAAAVELVEAAVPVEGLRLLSREFETREAAAGNLIRTWQEDSRGRVADLTEYPRDGERPEPDRLQYADLPSMEQEAWCSLMGRAVVWAAGRTSAEDAPRVDWGAQAVLDQSQLPEDLFVDGTAVSTTVRIWDADGRLQHAGVKARVPHLPSARYFIGIQERAKSGAVKGWRFDTFEIKSPLHLLPGELASPFVSPGERVSATVRLSEEPPEGARVRFEVIDNYRRCVFRTEQPAARAASPDFGPLCHWLDHALFLDEMFAGWHRERADVVEGADPGTVAWYDCTVEGWARPGSAWDFWKMSERSRFSVQYMNPMVHDIFQSAQQPGSYHGTWYGGYGLYNYAPFYDAEFHPWWCVFRGINLHGLYYGGNSPNYFEERLIAPDLGCTQHFEKTMENLNELKGGIAKLRHAKLRPDDSIYIADLRPKPVHITFDRTAHVYDVRNRMYRGYTNAIEDMLYPAKPVLYALLPYEVRDLELSATQEDVVFTLSGRIVAGASEADATPVTHVCHIELFDPAGNHRREYDRNVLAGEGRFEERFFLGYNAAPGCWRIVVQDGASGIERSLDLDVAKGEPIAREHG